MVSKQKKEIVEKIIQHLKKYGEFTFENRNISMVNGGNTQLQYEPVSIENRGIDINECSWFDEDYPFSYFNYGRGWSDQEKDFKTEEQIRKILSNCHLQDLRKGF